MILHRIGLRRRNGNVMMETTHDELDEAAVHFLTNHMLKRSGIGHSIMLGLVKLPCYFKLIAIHQ